MAFLLSRFVGGSCAGVSVSLQSLTNPNLPKAETQVCMFVVLLDPFKP